jgi:hypothetical protein
MVAVNCVGVFCEDIREEVSGTHTIIGVMPDNIVMTAAPNSDAAGHLLFPRLGIYVRMNLDPSYKPDRPIIAKVSIPGMAEFTLGEMGIEALGKAYADSAEKKNPLVGIIFKGTVSPVQLTESGLAKATVTIGEKEILCATLNIQIAR